MIDKFDLFIIIVHIILVILEIARLTRWQIDLAPPYVDLIFTSLTTRSTRADKSGGLALGYARTKNNPLDILRMA